MDEISPQSESNQVQPEVMLPNSANPVGPSEVMVERKKPKALVITLIILFMLITPLVAYYLGRASRNIEEMEMSTETMGVEVTPTETTGMPQQTPTLDADVDIETSKTSESIQSDLETVTIPYTPNPDWATYTDDVAGFSFQYRDTLASPNLVYPEGTYFKVVDPIPGESLRIDNCGTPASGAFEGQEICPQVMSLTIADTYTGGSRRNWLTNVFLANRPLFSPYFMNFDVAGANALVAIEGNPGGSSALYIAIPKGNRMIVFIGSGVWDPETGEIADLTFYKNLLSTFKFI